MGATLKQERNSDIDAVIVGAGFSGLYMLHRLRELGLEVRVFEAGSGVGGTWFWNRYPGARCDVDSLEYSYGFSEEIQQEWKWKERNSTQGDILRYLNHVADRLDLRRHVELETRVLSAVFDDASGRWTVETSRGERVTARFCVLATGCLSSANTPAFEGLETFRGPTHHTGRWPHGGVDFTGKRVGVIGTGSSGVQAIPLIAREAAHLHVFQRTASWVVPAGNRPIDPQDEKRIKADYQGFRARNRMMPVAFASEYPFHEDSVAAVAPEERSRRMEYAWQFGGFFPFGGCFADTMLDESANHVVAEFVRGKIRSIVRDPAVAELLCPTTPIGCKRLCLGIGYFETYNRPNVTLVDLRKAPISRLTPTGLETAEGSYELDAIVFATGFDAMTGSILGIDVRGRGGEPLARKWSAGPRTYLGLGIHGFPNLFTISGPGSPSVLTNMVVSIEQHVDWIATCIEYLRKHGKRRIEATLAAEDEWVEHVNMVAGLTLYPRCNSWYLGANVPGKPRVFMPYIGFPPYVMKCAEVVAKGDEGCELR